MRVVFSRPTSFAIVFVLTIMFIAVALWLPNWEFLIFILSTGAISILEKFRILTSSFLALQTNFAPTDRIVIIALASLFGVNGALFAFYVRRRLALERSLGVSVVGTIIGMIGIGCASCGSVFLASILGVGGAAGFLNILPFGGLEFGLVGAIFLLISIMLLAQKIRQPNVCD